MAPALVKAAGARVHRRERWWGRCAPSKAAKGEAVKATAMFLRNEPNFPCRAKPIFFAPPAWS
jgi:hypothetical protein